jgi:aldehyde:ferredoxin oxidoreductase
MYFNYRMLIADLDKMEIYQENLSRDLLDSTLGGCALGAVLFYMNLKPRIDPLGGDNVIIVAPGALTGSLVPTASKTEFFAKSPLTNGWGESVSGGSIGVELRSCGYEALMVKGKGERPVQIRVEDDRAEIIDDDLWGSDTYECSERLSRGGFSTACIGIAGENLVKMASIECDGRQAGRIGLGAVMGSKKLKAIAIRGSKDIEMAHKNIEGIARKWYLNLLKNPSYRDDTKYGSGEFLDWVNSERGTFPTKNWQRSVFDDRKEIDPYYWVPKYSIKNSGCFSCTKPCGKMFVIKEGRYAGTKVDGPEYETLYSLGAEVCNSDIEVLAKANELCDRLGMDTISTGVTIGFAMELYERGILTKKDVGMELKFGDGDALLEMIKKIAYREGIGDTLAEGSARAARMIGKGAERYAIHVKGLEPPAYDARGLKGMALAFATSPRGACHLRSGFYGIDLTGKWWMFQNVDRFSIEGKGEAVATMEDLMSLYDTLGVCKFSRHVYLVEALPELVEAVTGLKLSVEELLHIGERTNWIKKLINLREGLTRKEDTLPPRVMEDEILEGPSKGSKITFEELEKMVDDYYAARGWDPSGKPNREQIREVERFLA